MAIRGRFAESRWFPGSQWIGLRENRNRKPTIDFPMKIMGVFGESRHPQGIPMIVEQS